MLRAKLLGLLESYNPKDESEIKYKAQMLEFLKNNESCFERSCAIGHFTGSSWLENRDGSAFLLTKHKKLGLWLQLGGHADSDNDLLNVSIKEAQEESGIANIFPVSEEIFDLSVHLIPRFVDIPEHYHYDIRFFLKTNENDDSIGVSEESTDLRWFQDDEYLVDNKETLRMFNKWMELKRSQTSTDVSPNLKSQTFD